MEKQKVLVIVGPTASGKSALAVELARRFNGEIISADSRQVYRGLDIGTGKITKREMKGVPHHLLDVASPRKTFTAHDFIEKGHSTIASILQKGKLPIVVGGTGFYIDALVGQITLPNVPADKTLRARLEKKSAAQLFAMLKKRDPRRAKTIEPHNKRRLIRALEIIATLGRVPLNRKASNIHRGTVQFDALWIGVTLQSKVMEKRISARLLARMKRGMVAEARRLHNPPAGGGLSYKRMEELGLEYRSLARFLQGNISRAEMTEELTRDIRRYAKRQLAYWKRNKDIKWFDNPKSPNIAAVVRRWFNG